MDASGPQQRVVIFLHPLIDRGFQTNVTVLIEPTGLMTPAEYQADCHLQLNAIGWGRTSQVVNEVIDSKLVYTFSSTPIPVAP